jgi:hypothetical protein
MPNHTQGRIDNQAPTGKTRSPASVISITALLGVVLGLLLIA